MRIATLFLALVAPLTVASGTAAQTRTSQNHSAGRVPATLAMMDRLPAADAQYLILRRTDASPADVILLPLDANPQMLSDAVHALLLTRRNLGGDVPEANAAVRARYHDVHTRPVLPWAGRVLNDLQHAAPRSIAGVGDARAVVIWLPRQR
jgi:hypothetical protein